MSQCITLKIPESLSPAHWLHLQIATGVVNVLRYLSKMLQFCTVAVHAFNQGKTVVRVPLLPSGPTRISEEVLQHPSRDVIQANGI